MLLEIFTARIPIAHWHAGNAEFLPKHYTGDDRITSNRLRPLVRNHGGRLVPYEIMAAEREGRGDLTWFCSQFQDMLSVELKNWGRVAQESAISLD